MLSVLSLKSLPPTMEALKLNIKRAHYQTAIWKNVRMVDPVELNPEHHGWDKDTANRCMIRTALATASRSSFGSGVPIEGNILWLQ